MRINTNVAAIATTNRLINNQDDLNIRLERLSTGLRINRGADDPAGLIASEVLRSQIRGISQALENSQRAVNVISVAEAALNEVSSLILDLRSLIVHAANEGAISQSEIEADQLQIDSILEAIDRIANTTTFAGRKLIDGSLSYTVSGLHTSAIARAMLFGARVPDYGATRVTVSIIQSAQTAQLAYTGSSIGHNVTLELQGTRGTEIIAITSGSSIQQIAANINASTVVTGVSATVSGTGTSARLLLNSVEFGERAFVSVQPLEGDFIVSEGARIQDNGQDPSVLINGQVAAFDALTGLLRANGLDMEIELTVQGATTVASTTFYITGGGATFQIGPDVNPGGQISIGIPSIGTAHLGDVQNGFLNTIRAAGRNSIVGGHCDEAEMVVTKALNQIAVLRGRLGSLQRNQIETNMNSQRVALENVMASESAIRDADIATEVASLTRAQILVQSTSTVLGIANQLPRNVLSLLQG
ncbi:MAG: flagellin N-terminal helical domain-containing protein [Phycisphaerae bacterium]